MTHDQSDRYAIVPIAPGPVPKEAIVVGNIDQVFEYIPQSVARDDAMKELQAARLTHDQIAHAQERTRAVQAIMLNESLDRLYTRMDSFGTRQRERRRQAKARRDAAEAKRIQDALDALPDPDDPHAFTPSGELHPLPAKEEAAPIRRDQPKELEGFVGDPEPQPENKGSVVPQPIAISLNEG
jgi:hypothetical protein